MPTFLWYKIGKGTYGEIWNSKIWHLYLFLFSVKCKFNGAIFDFKTKLFVSLISSNINQSIYDYICRLV